MRIEPYSLAFVPDYFKTQELCDKAIEIDPFTLWHVPDNLKTQGMCIKAVEVGLGLLGCVPDWFVTQQQIKIWRDDNECCDDDELTYWVVWWLSKTQGRESKNKGRTFTHRLASQSCDGLMYERRLSDTKITASGYILTSPGLKIWINMGVYKLMTCWINEVPDFLKTQEICNMTVFNYLYLLEHIPDHFKTQEMCNEAVRREL